MCTFTTSTVLSGVYNSLEFKMGFLFTVINLYKKCSNGKLEA